MARQWPNPPVPFSEPIPEGLIEGKGLKIKGHIPKQAQRFAVNLVCANGDIAFHFNPRFDEGPVVVCNTMHGCWGTDERPSEMPFQRDASFAMTVIIRSDCYQVSVNGRHFLKYLHRLSTQDIRKLEIKGDVDLKKVTLKDISKDIPDSTMEINNMKTRRYIQMASFRMGWWNLMTFIDSLLEVTLSSV